MRLIPLDSGGLTLVLDHDEASLIDHLTGQLIDLLQSHSSTALDPDPLFASLEIGGSEETPEDPALARLFPNAYAEDEESATFRRVTEQGLLNRKLQDALAVTGELGLDAELADSAFTKSDFTDATLADETFTESATTDPDISGSASRFRPRSVEVLITEHTLPIWVRTLTSLRLAIAARMGMIEDEDHSRLAADPETHGTIVVYDWLAAVLDSMLHMMDRDTK